MAYISYFFKLFDYIKTQNNVKNKNDKILNHINIIDLLYSNNSIKNTFIYFVSDNKSLLNILKLITESVCKY